MSVTHESEADCLTQPYPPHLDVDERTLLLSKTSSQTSSPAAQCEAGKKALIDEHNSKRELIGVAVGVFTGTIGAGLGKFGSQVMRVF